MTDLFAPGRRDVPSDVQNEVLTAVGARNLKRAMYAMDLKALVNKDNAWRMRQRREVFEQSPTVRKLLEPFTNVPLDFWNWAAYVSEPGSPKLFLWDPMEPGTDYINDEDGMRREITKLGAGVASMSRLFPDVQTWFPRLNETMEGLELHRMSIHIRPGALPRPDLVWCVYRDCVSPMLLGSQQQFAVFDRSHVPYESVVRAYPPRLSRAYTSAHDIVGVYNTHAEAMQNVVWRAEYRRVWPVPRSDGGAYATYNEAIRHPTLITSEITVYYDLVGEGLSVVSQINGLGSMTKEELHALVMSKEPETGPRLPPGDMFKDPYTLNEEYVALAKSDGFHIRMKCLHRPRPPPPADRATEVFLTAMVLRDEMYLVPGGEVVSQ